MATWQLGMLDLFLFLEDHKNMYCILECKCILQLIYFYHLSRGAFHFLSICQQHSFVYEAYQTTQVRRSTYITITEISSKLEKLTKMTKLVEVDSFSSLSAGTQIAVKNLVKNLDSKWLSRFTKVEYYFHHGVYMGDYQVVDFHGESKKDAKPRECKLYDFMKGCQDNILYRVEYVNADVTLPVHETLKMANDILADPQKWPKFRLFWNNCETFATWLKTNKKFLFK